MALTQKYTVIAEFFCALGPLVNFIDVLNSTVHAVQTELYGHYGSPQTISVFESPFFILPTTWHDVGEELGGGAFSVKKKTHRGDAENRERKSLK
jgi:hypothetical protein